MAWNQQITRYRVNEIAQTTLRRTTKWTSGEKRDPNVRNIHTRNNPPIIKGRLVT